MYAVATLIASILLTLPFAVSARITGAATNHCAVISPPPSVAANAINVNQMRCFDEQQSFQLTSNLVLDGAVTIPAGTLVASHYVVFDPPTTTLSTRTIALDADVLGFASSDTLLGATDFLGVPPTNYGGAYPHADSVCHQRLTPMRS